MGASISTKLDLRFHITKVIFMIPYDVSIVTSPLHSRSHIPESLPQIDFHIGIFNSSHIHAIKMITFPLIRTMSVFETIEMKRSSRLIIDNVPTQSQENKT